MPAEHPQYLQLEYLHMIVTVELIQSMLTNHHKSSTRRMPPSAHVHTCCPHITVISKACRARVLLLLLQNTISPLLVQCSAFSLTLCGTCTIFLRTRVILAELATDAEVLLTFFIKLVSSETRLVGPARVDKSARNGDHAGMLLPLSIIIRRQVYITCVPGCWKPQLCEHDEARTGVPG